MSLNLGRKLGLMASLITVIMPVVAVIAGVFMVLSLFATIQSWTNPVMPTGSFFSAGYIVFLIISAIVGLVGFILFIVAMYQLSHYYKESGIFKNIVYALIVNIGGTIFVFVLFFVFLSSSISSITQPSTIATPFLTQFVFSFLALVVVALVFGIICAVFYMRAFTKLGEKSGVDSFKTAGVLYLVGVLLSIVFIGGFLVWIAWIFAAWGFRSLKPLSSTNIFSTQSVGASPLIAQTRRCPYCGTENIPNAIYCGSCGNQLNP